VLDAFDHAVGEARRAGGAADVLRIGCIPFLPIRRLLAFLEAARDSLPHWQTEVTHMGTLDQLAAIRTGALDMGMFHYAEEHEGLELVPIFPGEPLVAYLPQDDALAGETVITPPLVAERALVIFAREVNPTLHDHVRRLLAEAGYEFRDVHETGGRDSVRDLLVAVAAGKGINVAPFSVKELSEAGDIVVRRPIDPPLRAPDTVLALPAEPSQRLQDAVEGIRRLAGQCYEQALASEAAESVS
jgi:DNA-binding transcriptional LysR family regulator